MGKARTAFQGEVNMKKETAFLLLAWLTIAYSLTYIFDYEDPVKVLEGHLIPDQMKEGDVFTAEWKLQWNRLCPAEALRTYVDRYGVHHPIDTTRVTDPGVTGIITSARQHVFPRLPYGGGQYRMVWRMWCNPFQQFVKPIMVEFPPLPYTAIE